MNGFELEAGARLALDVAKGMAAAMGDERCGTEHLLFGIVATSGPDMENLTELFALDKSRVERAVAVLRHEWCVPTEHPCPDPPLSTRAELVLYTGPVSGESLGPFDVLLGCLSDPRSGASSVLRYLGVSLGEVRRLAEIGAARLTIEQVERLVGSLDRRSSRHDGWWGPPDDASVAVVELPDGPSVVLSTSRSAVLTLNRVVAGEEGFGITLMITSTDTWVLPPRWVPGEALIPGFGARPELSPDVVTIDLTYEDDLLLTNRRSAQRFRRDCPTDGSLALLATHRTIENRCDRRIPEQRCDSAEWWAWPLPPKGIVTLSVDWAAESLHGTIDIDASRIHGSAAAVRHGY